MISSRERSKLWVERELPGHHRTIEFLWEEWELDSCPAGLDYFLLHCGVAFGPRQVKDWVVLCSKDLPAKSIKDLSLSEGLLLMDRIELLWRRRMRSSPGWDSYRSSWVNVVNRVMKRARNLAQETQLVVEKACV